LEGFSPETRREGGITVRISRQRKARASRGYRPSVLVDRPKEGNRGSNLAACRLRKKKIEGATHEERGITGVVALHESPKGEGGGQCHSEIV